MISDPSTRFTIVQQKRNLKFIKNPTIGELYFCEREKTTFIFTKEEGFIPLICDDEQYILNITNCKNCGAPLTKDGITKCEYCLTIY